MKNAGWMTIAVCCAAAWVPTACNSSTEVTDFPGDGDGDDVEAGDGDGDGDGVGGEGGASAGGPFELDGGLGEAGNWRGYFFTAAEEESTITPDEFTGDELCASGELAAGYAQWALVGWNIAQEIDDETFVGGEVGTIEPGGSGIAFDVENSGGSGLRIQIQADDMGVDSWCAPVPAGGVGTLAWDEFRKECWTTGGEVYDPSTPLAQIAVQTYSSSDTMPTSFEYCVNSLAPAP